MSKINREQKSDYFKDSRNYPHDYSTDELKVIIGDFEKQYQSNQTGKMVKNDILGYMAEGIISFAESLGAITKHPVSLKYSVHIPGYELWTQKYQAMLELQSRRWYAKRANMTPEELAEDNQKREERLQGIRNQIRVLFAKNIMVDDIRSPETIMQNIINDKQGLCVTCGQSVCNCEVRTVSHITF